MEFVLLKSFRTMHFRYKGQRNLGKEKTRKCTSISVENYGNSTLQEEEEGNLLQDE